MPFHQTDPQFAPKVITGVTSLAAAGTNQATATAVTTGLTKVTASDGVKGVILPTVTSDNVGARYVLNNSVANVMLNIYPEVGGTIDGQAANAAVGVLGLGIIELVCTAAATWVSSRPTATTPTVAAAGTNQGNAAAIAAPFTKVTASDGTKGVILPAVNAQHVGMIYRVYNSVNAQALKVYPATGGTIDGGAANANAAVTGVAMGEFVVVGVDTWLSSKQAIAS